jgi:hypothetical protein
MGLIVADGSLGAQGDAHAVSTSHPLRPILYLVFSLKIAVAAVLLASVALAPPVAAEGSYLASN